MLYILPSEELYDGLPSTNSKLRQRLEEEKMLPDRYAVRAAYQTAGRGRLLRTFVSPAGGLYLSIWVRLEAGERMDRAYIERPALLTLAAGLAAAEAVECAGELPRGTVALKWVNDLYVNGRKLGGILTEGIAEPAAERLTGGIVGIGINLTAEGLPEDMIPPPISMEHLTGRKTAAADVSAAVRTALDRVLAQPAEEMLDAWKNRCCIFGKAVYWAAAGSERSGIAVAYGLADDGSLLLKDADGRTFSLFAGEVTVRPADSSDFFCI